MPLAGDCAHPAKMTHTTGDMQAGGQAAATRLVDPFLDAGSKIRRQ
jgi:hypothetical protein